MVTNSLNSFGGWSDSSEDDAVMMILCPMLFWCNGSIRHIFWFSQNTKENQKLSFFELTKYFRAVRVTRKQLLG